MNRALAWLWTGLCVGLALAGCGGPGATAARSEKTQTERPPLGMLAAPDAKEGLCIGAPKEAVAAAFPKPEGGTDLPADGMPDPYSAWGWNVKQDVSGAGTFVAYFKGDRLVWASRGIGPLTGREAGRWVEAYTARYGEPQVEKEAGRVLRRFVDEGRAISLALESRRWGSTYVFSATLTDDSAVAAMHEVLRTAFEEDGE